MADIVKDILDKTIRQRKIIFQQKKPLLNYELNLAQDILKENLEELTKISIGDNYSGESLQVVPGPLTNEIIIRKGTFYHQGVPVSMTADKRMFVNTPPGAGVRYDVIYALWRIEQVDSPADPLIGFSTTQEQRVSLDIVYEVDTQAPTSVPQEEVTFTAIGKSIVLSRGFFPDWLRIVGTRFRTNAVVNGGSPYFTVALSPNSKTLIVEENITNQISSDVRFTMYDPSLEIPREYRAYRDNIIILAVLDRVAGNFNINPQYIRDGRIGMANNFVVKGCTPTISNTPLTVNVSLGEFLVGNDKEFIESNTSISILNDNFNYVYLNKDGDLESSITEPTQFHVMLAEVQARDGAILNLKDVRQFKPASNGGSSSESSSVGEGLTGFTAVSNNYTAGEDINSFELVYMGANAKVGRASASNKLRLPVIAIANEQPTLLNQKNVFVTLGVLQNPAWSWSAGDDLFVDASSGSITNYSGVELLGNNQYVQRIGVALSSDKILFKPDLTLYKKDDSAEIKLLTLRENGSIEVMGSEDRISPDRLNFLASAATLPATTSFEILPGRYFIEGSLARHFSGLAINMGVTGTTYRTSAIPSNYYNKAFFTLDKNGIVKMYEGVPSSSVPLEDPSAPDSELPLCVISFQDNGAAGNGTIQAIVPQSITDKRPWLNTGSVEDSAFQAIYRSNDKVLVQAGEAWISKRYFILSNNLEITVDTSEDKEYYFYFDITSIPSAEPNLDIAVNSSHFIALDQPPSNLHRREYILLARYTVSGGLILRNTFKTYKSRFWDFQDIPFFGEQVWNVQVPMDEFTTTSLATINQSPFTFDSRDFLRITVNGIELYEGDDYTKDGSINKVTMNYPILAGASVRIRKI